MIFDRVADEQSVQIKSSFKHRDIDSRGAWWRQRGCPRVALGKIERRAVVPRARTLAGLAKALAVPVGELVTPVRSLDSVRFRARARVHSREQILAEVSKWLDAYNELEAALNEGRKFVFELVPTRGGPVETARAAREVAQPGPQETVCDICGLLEEHGVKLR